MSEPQLQRGKRKMPNGDQDYTRWKVSQAEFMGYVKATLDEIKHEVSSMKECQKENDKKFNEYERRLTSTEVKGGIFGTLAAVIVAIASWIFGR